MSFVGNHNFVKLYLNTFFRNILIEISNMKKRHKKQYQMEEHSCVINDNFMLRLPLHKPPQHKPPQQ